MMAMMAMMAMTAVPHLSAGCAKRALAISFGITLAFGCAYILWRWGGRKDWVDGVLRCVTFGCAMVAVHAWGYQLYRRQGAAALPSTSIARPCDDRVVPVEVASRADRSASARIEWVAIIVQQASLLLVGSVLLDGGSLFHVAAEGSVVYWAAVLVGRALRHGKTTPTERLMLNVGYWPLVSIIAVAQTAVWTLKGLSGW